MSEPSLRELEEQRDRLYAQLAATGDFRRGSVTQNYRKCGTTLIVCAGCHDYIHANPVANAA